MVVCGLEPSKITLWASSWWPSSQARVTSAKSESLSSIKFPNALLMLSWKSFHWRLVKEEQTISLFSFYSRNKRKEFQYSFPPLEFREMVSLPLLEIGESEFRFLFLLSKVEKWFLFLFSKLGKMNSDFSFSSQNWRNSFQISPSLLDLTFLPLVNHWLKWPKYFWNEWE